MMATKKGMIDAVKLLLDRGADISNRDQVHYLIQNTLSPHYFLGVILVENENNIQTLWGMTDLYDNTVVCNIM